MILVKIGINVRATGTNIQAVDKYHILRKKGPPEKRRLLKGNFVISYKTASLLRVMRVRLNSRILLLLLVLVTANALPFTRALAEDYLDYYEQGEFALRVQKWDRAIEFFTRAIQDNPKFFVAYHNRAIAYSKRGEYDKSIQDLKKATQLNPDYPDAYGLMGLVYEIKKDNAAALEAYRAALSREKRPAARKFIEKNIRELEARVKKK
jgi:tetratricopeptide (TPR) repeat protein